MFLKHKSVHARDECPIHGEDTWHTFEFVRYHVSKNRIVVRLRCDRCHEAEIEDWLYYEVSPQYWLGFLVSHNGNDFTGAS